MTTKRRAHEHEITIAAPPDEVWRAITEAAELTRWFPVTAGVEPGAGGTITYGWPPDFEGSCAIVAWDPPRHLRTGWCFQPPGIPDDEWRHVAVDWTLEGRSGSTVLRVVHSGFGAGGTWDDEFDGSNRGWEFELRSLAHYLERHRGAARETLWLRQPTSLAPADAWPRIAPALAPLTGGPRIIDAAPDEVAGRVPALNDGLYRAGVERFGGPVAHVFLSAWGVPRDALVRFAAPFEEALRQLGR
jgi:uncharacterized protein YndB with AHSA1/START domain